MKVCILGGTKGMGRAMARLFAERGDQIVLLGRSLDKIGRSAKDLEARGATGRVGAVLCDLLEPNRFELALSEADQILNGVDCVVVTAGLFAQQEALEGDPGLTAQLLTANFTNTVRFCESARRLLMERGGGRLCVFSSVAGERGRKPVVLYGASKAGLSKYLEGLDHRYRGDGLITICVKPGFVKTGMTEGLKPPPFAGEPEAVAHRVVRAIDRGEPEVYAPGPWQLVMCIIRLLPRFVMRKVSF